MTNLVITLKNPYNFEGENYDQIDLSNIENLNAKTMGEIERKYTTMFKIADPNKELSMDFACIAAAEITKKPIEFFQGLPIKVAMEVKTAIAGFIYDLI